MRSGRERVAEFARAREWVHIGEAEWNVLRAALPEVSVHTIQQAGLEIEPPWRGVEQHTLHDLETSLNRFSEIYASRPDLRAFCRRQVIAAKARARGAARSEVRRELKTEMVQWMLVWLSDPALFPAWAALRLKQLMV